MHKLRRVFHPWSSWECYKAGLYSTVPPKRLNKDECLEAYRLFLSDLTLFDAHILLVFKQWPNSCQQFLTNDSMNRVAWLGQTAMCLYSGVPACFRGGFKLLSEEQQRKADATADRRLHEWIKNEYTRQNKEIFIGLDE